MSDCEITPEEIEECMSELKEFMNPFIVHFGRREQREHGVDFVRGLLSDLERKSVEPIAERAGKDRRGLQKFIGTGGWDYRLVTEELCRQVGQEFGKPDGILVLDPSGFLKKGKNSVGVGRQYCGRTGGVENCQKGVFLSYVSELGRTLVDMRLYLPEKWVKDRKRLRDCYVPKGIRHQTSCELGMEMVLERRALLPHAWLVGDAELGHSADFRMDLAEEKERYVLDILSTTCICDAEKARAGLAKGTAIKKLPWIPVQKYRDMVPADKWTRIVVRDGSKGPIVYHATRKRVRTRWRGRVAPVEEWLIIMRDDTQKTKYRYCLSNAAEEISLEELVRTAAARYWIEDCFERAKGQVGLADYEVRSWDGWHHHMALSLLGLWFLVKEQRRLKRSTPAITLQQSKAAIAELLRNPELSARTLAERITRKLKRNELARIAHWKKSRKLAPRHVDMK